MVSKTDINPVTQKMYAVNPATGNFDDNYWATVVEPQLKGGDSGGDGGGGTSTNPVNNLLSGIINDYTKKVNTYNQKYADYTKNNPFVFDDVLKNETSKAQQRLDPYYQQTLGDFLQGISIKRSRSLEDERNLLAELQNKEDRFTQQAREQAGSDIESARAAQAGAGQAESGTAQRETGNILNNANAAIGNYVGPSQYQQRQTQLGTQRLVGTDLPIAQALETRNLNREQSYNVNQQAQNAANQDYNTYQYKLNQYTGAYPGVTPTDYNNIGSILSAKAA